MPIYEYQCTECGKKFEARQSIGEDGSELTCPACGTTVPHGVGAPCYDLDCPKCGAKMVRG